MWGIDAAPRMIAIARHKAETAGLTARFAPGVAEELDFADGAFDVVVNSMFTHHIDTELKRQAFAEMYPGAAPRRAAGHRRRRPADHGQRLG